MDKNYIVSARKYRPAAFASVVGQSHITSTLKNAISRGQLAHAYLFCGPRGVGKTTCARIFAKAINCLAPRDSEACGECESCRSFNEGRSFNIHELDAASNNSVDDIRTLTEQVRIPPQTGRYSVYIIDEVHMLSSAAFNAFLKTLEEPPAHAIFILATTEKHKIIPTILSRCQIYDFNRIKAEDAVGYLKSIADREGIACDEQSLNLIARKADGGMRDALSMFDKAVSFCGNRLNYMEVAKSLNILDYDTYFSATDIIKSGDYKEALLLLDSVLSRGFSAQTFISGLAGHLRDLLVASDESTRPLLETTGELSERYAAQSKECPAAFLFDALALLADLDGGFRTATDQRLHTELGLLKLCRLSGGPGAPASTPKPPAPQPSPAEKPSRTSSAKAPSGEKSAPETRHTAQTAPQSAPPPPKPATAGPLPPFEQAPFPEKEPPAAPAGIFPPKSPVELQTDPARKHVSGISISSALNAGAGIFHEPEHGEPPVKTDPHAAEKAAAARERFLKALRSKRPRFATALENMTVEGNALKAEVPNELLREDLLRNRKEVLELLAETAGIEGTMDMDITVSENKTAVKLIKVEDKLNYLLTKNPALTLLRKELDLEPE